MKTINVLLRSEFKSNTGYGWAAVGLAKSLGALREVQLKIEDVRDPNLFSPLSKEDLALIAPAFDTTFIDPPIIVNFLSPPEDHSNLPHKALINHTVFETEKFPDFILNAIKSSQQVWLPSKFCIKALLNDGFPEEKIRFLPHPIVSVPDDEISFEYLKGPFRFLSVANFSDPRKNLDGLIRAFYTAFSYKDNVELNLKVYTHTKNDVILMINKIRNQMKIYRLRPIIRIISKYMTSSELNNLYRSNHAFILLSKGEGWGLPYSEAMSFGLPTIGTNWSGNLEFMNEGNSFLINVKEFESVKGFLASLFPESNKPLWAKPDEEHAAYLMKFVFENYFQARKIALKGKNEITRKYSPILVAKQAAAFLKELSI
jgi:glycosyltransferase involved in cell wall biosynthesis